MIAYTIYADDFELYNAEEGINLGVTSAKLNLEINKVGTFNFSLKLHCDAVKTLKPYISNIAVQMRYLINDGGSIVTKDSYFPFVGRITDITRDIYGNIDVECEEMSAILNDIPIPVKSGHHGRTIDDILTLIQTNYLSVVENEKRTVVYDSEDSVDADFAYEPVDEQGPIDIGDDSNTEDTTSDTEWTYVKGYDYVMNEIMDEISGMIYFAYGYSITTGATMTYGYLSNINPGLSYTRKNGSMPGYEKSIYTDVEDLFGAYPTFAIGANILSIDEDPIKNERYSGIMPVGKNGLTIGGEENVTWDDVIWIEGFEKQYGRIVKQVEFSEIENVDELVAAATNFITAYGIDTGNRFTINAIEPCEVIDDVNNLVRVGHITVVQNSDGTIYVYPTLSISLDLFDIKNNEYVVGPYVPDAIVSERISSR